MLHIFLWFSIIYSLQFLSTSPQRKKINKIQIFPPAMHYYTYPVQLNQKGDEKRVNYHMSVFQIPQILGIMTLFKNWWRFRDKYFVSHQQESSLSGNIPSLQHTGCCTQAVSVRRTLLLGGKEKAFETRVVPVGLFRFIDSVGQARHWMFCN